MRVVVLLDVDNTLLNNDLLKSRLNAAVVDCIGVVAAQHFWKIYEDIRREIGHVDVPMTLQRLKLADPSINVDALGLAIDSFPYAESLFVGALPTINALGSRAIPVILSDGDNHFQRRKIEASGLAAAVAGRVLIYFHKEDRIDEVTAAYPADHYVMVDDKARLLGKFKTRLGERLTTLHVNHGGYAAQKPDAGDPLPDVEIADIGDVIPIIPGLVAERV